MDQGRRGLQDTYHNIRKYDLLPLGFGENHEEACQPQLLTEAPRKVYLYSSLQVPSENWTFLENKPGVCEESLRVVASRIQKLRKADTDAVVLVQLHWGTEHTLQPQIHQKQQARQLIDAGADAVIGHHPHTVQTIEWYRGKPIYYSIGNFIFDQSRPINSNGIMVKLEIDQTEILFDTIPFLIEKCRPRITEME